MKECINNIISKESNCGGLGKENRWSGSGCRNKKDEIEKRGKRKMPRRKEVESKVWVIRKEGDTEGGREGKKGEEWKKERYGGKRKGRKIGLNE